MLVFFSLFNRATQIRFLNFELYQDSEFIIENLTQKFIYQRVLKIKRKVNHLAVSQNQHKITRTLTSIMVFNKY